MSDKQKIDKYIQIINNCIDYLSEEHDTEEILTIFDTTPSELNELDIPIM